MLTEMVVYGRPNCNYCIQAIELLKDAKVHYKYINIWEDNDAKQFLVNQGLKTVPQMFVTEDKETHIGGFEDLVIHLEERGLIDV